MTSHFFPDHVVTALDRYVVPPLPADFADRLVARAIAGDLPEPVSGSITPLPRLRTASPWRRTGRIMGSLAAITLATATAAAAGLLGDRVYIPYVTDILVQANVIDAEKPQHEKPVAKITVPVPQPGAISSKDALTGPEAVKDMRATLMNDPAFRALPPAQKAARLKAETRALIASGHVSPDDLREARKERVVERKQKAEALRERYEQATPEEQAAMREEARRKRAEWLARRRDRAGGDDAPASLPEE